MSKVIKSGTTAANGLYKADVLFHAAVRMAGVEG
jgi:hypothetical protein